MVQPVVVTYTITVVVIMLVLSNTLTISKVQNYYIILDMGFDAIWISPVVDNYDNGYHGYWARNIYGVN